MLRVVVGVYAHSQWRCHPPKLSSDPRRHMSTQQLANPTHPKHTCIHTHPQHIKLRSSTQWLFPAIKGGFKWNPKLRRSVLTCCQKDKTCLLRYLGARIMKTNRLPPPTLLSRHLQFVSLGLTSTLFIRLGVTSSYQLRKYLLKKLHMSAPSKATVWFSLFILLWSCQT